MITDAHTTRKVLLIFADSSLKSGKADAGELQRILQEAANASQRQLEFYVTTARSLSYFVSNDESRIYDHANKHDLKDYDFVYFRKAGSVMQQMLACARYLEIHGVPYADAEIGRGTSRNKLSQMFMLQARGISIPTTLFVRNRKRLVRLLATTYKDKFQWPVIAKASGGTRGDANYLVKSLEELEQLVGEVKRHFLIQTFIPNDGDYRALVVHGKLRGLIHRKGEEGSHLNNTSKNGAAAWLPIDTFNAEQTEIAVRAAAIFGRDIAGVDVLVDKETNVPYILEVNRAPQIENASYPEEKAEMLIDGIIDMMNDYHKAPDASAKKVVGRREHVSLPTFPSLGIVTAKVDTGAYSNTLHVEYVEEAHQGDATVLRFSPTGKDTDVYETEKYAVKNVVSSNGMSEDRYIVDLPFVMGGETYNGQVTLSNRAKMQTPILIGRKFLKQHGLIVDTAKRFTQ